MTAVERASPMGLSGLTHSPAHNLAARQARRFPIALPLVAIVLAGLGVRLWLARGPLSLDEIWSIENLAPLTRFWQVFWGISHDNNHFLNSLWLYFVTELTADELALRAPSIAMGVLTIAIMARLAARHSPAAAIAAAAMTAASCFFVNYSVEARGYAGLALAIVIAFEALERAIARPDSSARFVFAAAAGIGLLCHLAMLPAIVLFGLICFAEKMRDGGRWRPAAESTMRIFAPTVAAIVPALAFVVAGAFVVGHITMGGVRGFDAPSALGAIAEMTRDAIGLPSATPTVLVVAAAAVAILGALRWRLVRNDRRIAYAVILLALPVAVLVLRPPNAHIARYYLICAVFLILLIAEAFGALWRLGLASRLGALGALAAMLAGSISQLNPHQASKDAGWPQALADISASGQKIIGSSFDDRVGRFVAYYNRDHAPIELVGRANWCAKRPQWLIAETLDGAAAPQNLDLSAGDCRIRLDFVRHYQAWGLSQIGWALYRAL
jgi:hypothetical protein